MTNGLLTAEVIFFCQIIIESLGRNSAGCISEQSATSQEIEFERWIIFFSSHHLWSYTMIMW